MPRAAINVAAAATTIVIAAVAGKEYRISRLFIAVAAAQNVTLVDGATNITGAMPLTAAYPIDFNKETLSPIVITRGNAFSVITSAAVQTGGWVDYDVS